MSEDDFYRKLTEALLGMNFQFAAIALSREEISKDRDILASNTRRAMQLAPPIVGTIHTAFDEHFVQQRLKKMRGFARMVGFKYVLGQPVLVAVVEADKITDEKAIEFANLFDSVILEMLAVTAKLGGVKIGGLHLGGTKLSVTGITLHVFFDRASALKFAERTQERCKIQRFLKKTCVLPWAIDVSSGAVSGHRGLPFLPAVLSKKNLQRAIFQ